MPDCSAPSDLRRELTSYLHRMLMDPQFAEDLAQETFVRALDAGERAPTEPEHYRRWMFRIATNLAIDFLRQRKRRGELSMLDLREDAENDPAFVERSSALVGTPETAAIASEHLAACFACSLANLPERKAAALLLTEVHGFSVAETAEALGVTLSLAKNAIQDARRVMVAKYDATCALIAKQGVCHQCDELADFFGAGRVALNSGPEKWTARLEVLRTLRLSAPGVWHTLLLGRVRPGDTRPASRDPSS